MSKAAGELQQAIWMVVESIPPGRVASYGQIARLAGHAGLARQVGRILARHPQPDALPWHRVLRADGRIAFPPASDQYLRQQQGLRAEGVVVRQGRVPRAYWWLP